MHLHHGTKKTLISLLNSVESTPLNQSSNYNFLKLFAGIMHVVSRLLELYQS